MEGKGSQAIPGTGRKAARVSGQRVQEIPSRCSTHDKTCHTVPMALVTSTASTAMPITLVTSTAQQVLSCPCQPTLPAHPAGNGGVRSLSSSLTAAFC